MACIFPYRYCHVCRHGRIHGISWFDIQITLGEMITLLPVPGGFIELATRCISPVIVRTTGDESR